MLEPIPDQVVSIPAMMQEGDGAADVLVLERDAVDVGGAQIADQVVAEIGATLL